MRNRLISSAFSVIVIFSLLFTFSKSVYLEPENPISDKDTGKIKIEIPKDSKEADGIYSAIAAASYEKQSEQIEADNEPENTPPEENKIEDTPENTPEPAEEPGENADSEEENQENEDESETTAEEPNEEKEETEKSPEIKQGDGKKTEKIEIKETKQTENEKNEKKENKDNKPIDNENKSTGKGTGSGGSNVNNNGGGRNDEKPEPPDEDDPKIATDLKDSIKSTTELSGDILPFTARLVNGGAAVLTVNIRNDSTRDNGEYLSHINDIYEPELCLGKNYITMYVKRDGVTILQKTFVIDYVAEKANDEKPEVGENPPTIETNLDNFSANIKNEKFVFTVKARDYNKTKIPASNITVTLDGKTIINPTGSDTFEYDLFFKPPESGDFVDHIVTVTAWDNKGNSSFKRYSVTQEYIDTGMEIGKAAVYIDATVVGLGILDEGFEYVIRQGVPAAYAIKEALEAYEYDFKYEGTPEVGFYLKKIERRMLTNRAEIPENLKEKIIDDGIELNNISSKNSLGEFDYTQGSGWMYEVNGAFPGRGLDEYTLADGSVICIRFTLAYGKDIGGYDSKGGKEGRLSSYCGKWIDGSYIPMHVYDEGKITEEASCEHSGAITFSCRTSGCTEHYTEEIPKGEHNYIEESRREPTETEGGEAVSVCEHCGDRKVETSEATGGEPDDSEELEGLPEDTEDPPEEKPEEPED